MLKIKFLPTVISTFLAHYLSPLQFLSIMPAEKNNLVNLEQKLTWSSDIYTFTTWTFLTTNLSCTSYSIMTYIVCDTVTFVKLFVHQFNISSFHEILLKLYWNVKLNTTHGLNKIAQVFRQQNHDCINLF